MLTLEECSGIAGLASDEIYLGATPGSRHRALLDSYLMNMWRGPRVVCDMIIGDLRRCADLGAKLLAADLLIVLRQFLSARPCASSPFVFERRNYMGVSEEGESFSRQCAQGEPANGAQVIALDPRRLGPSSWWYRETRAPCKPRLAS
jgi:hypothetical protein